MRYKSKGKYLLKWGEVTLTTNHYFEWSNTTKYINNWVSKEDISKGVRMAISNKFNESPHFPSGHSDGRMTERLRTGNAVNTIFDCPIGCHTRNGLTEINRVTMTGIRDISSTSRNSRVNTETSESSLTFRRTRNNESAELGYLI